MKKTEIREFVFYAPVVILLLLYAFVFEPMTGAFQPWTWMVIIWLTLSGYFMSNGKALGCLPGIMFGAVLIFTELYNTNRLPYEFNRAPIGAVICIYYAICGFLSRENKNTR